MPDKNKLLGYMASNGYTQRTLAKQLNVSKNTLNSKINGKSAFDTILIDKICDVLHITEDAEKARIFLKTSSHNRDESA